MRVLVTGATGFVGSRIVPALVEAGHDVTALVRDPGPYDPPAGVAVRTGDLLEPGSFEAVLEGIDAVYYLVHSLQAGADAAERDRRAAHNFAAAASDAEVDRVVYLGGLGEERDASSDHLTSRREVEHVLASGSYELTTLRAAIIVGEGSASFRVVRNLAERLPVMATPRWVRSACQPIAVDDVLAYLVGVLDAPGTAGRAFEIGGPDVLTYEEMVRRVSRRLRGRDPLVLPVPFSAPDLSAAWLGLVTDVPRSVASVLVLELTDPVVVSDDAIDDYVRIETTDFTTAVDRALGTGAEDEADRGDATVGAS